MLGWMLVVTLACEAPPATGPQPGQAAPELQGTALDGRTVALQGEPTLVLFWASWCGPCRALVPQLHAHERDGGASILTVAVGEPDAVAGRAAATLGMTWPILPDAHGHIRDAWQIDALPTVLLVDEQGIVRYRGDRLPTQLDPASVPPEPS